MIRAFCRWRLAVWTRRLNRRRAVWLTVPESRTTDWLFWEAQVTKAQVQMVKWRKRAGLSRKQGGPVR